MKRHQIILAGVLVVQVALGAVLLWPRSAKTVAAAPLLVEAQAEDVVGLTIEESGGKQIALRRETGAWVLPAADNYPAQAEAIDTLINKLVVLKTDRLVTRTAASHKRLQVAADDLQRRITLALSDGQQIVLYLGSSPAYGATHVRLDGRDETYLTSDLSSWETNTAATNWVDSRYLDLVATDIVAVTVTNAQVTITVRQPEADTWTLDGLAEGETVDDYAISSFAARAGSLTLQEPLGLTEQPEYGLAEPLATVSIALADRTVTVTVGSKSAADNSYVIKSSESPYFVRAAEYAVRDLVEYTRDQLLQQPEPATPGVSQ
jgi:hypothetical protein